MLCFILKVIYNIFPLTFLRAIIIEKHFLTCKRCGEEFELEEIKTPERPFQQIDLWPLIYEKLALKENRKKIIKVFHWAFVSSLIITSIGLGLLIYQNTKKTLTPTEEKREGSAIVENAYIRGGRAKVYIFKTKKPDLSIIWLEPDREYNYK